MPAYLPRLLDRLLSEFMSGLPAVSVDGARGVGKTALAERVAKTVFRLDDADVRLRLSSDTTLLEKAEPPVLIDEWQQLPDVWNAVRRSVDMDYSAGRFVLTGSAFPAAAAGHLHSGAGRIVRLRLRPFSLSERNLGPQFATLANLLNGVLPEGSAESNLTYEGYIQEIVTSGFPAIRTLPARLRNVQLDSYLSNILERGFEEIGVSVRRPEMLRAWLCSYAAATGTTASYTTILDAATPGEYNKPARTTTNTWRSALENLWLLDPVPAWLPGGGVFSRLASAAKHYLVDPALAVRLLALNFEPESSGSSVATNAAPQSGGILGNLFESLVAQSLQTYAQVNDARLYHFKQQDGVREVDFIVEKGNTVVAFEVKLSGSVVDRDVRHLNWLEERLGDRLAAKVVLNSGSIAYTRPKDGVLVLPAILLGAL